MHHSDRSEILHSADTRQQCWDGRLDHVCNLCPPLAREIASVWIGVNGYISFPL